MRLRTLVLAGVIAVVVATAAAVAIGATVLARRTAQRELRDDLARSSQVFEELHAFRRSLARAEGRVMAEEPRLKAVVATEEVNHETAFGVALDLKKALQSDIFLLIDAEGLLLADATAPDAYGHDMKENDLVARALAEGEAWGFWLDERSVYEVQARRMSHGATTAGVLVIGSRVDDRLLRAVHRQTETSMVVLLDGKPIAASPLAGGREAGAAVGLAAVRPGAAAPSEVTLGGVRYLAIAARYPGWTRQGDLRYVLLRSLDAALAPARRLTLLVYLITGAGVLAALLVAWLVARRLSRPVDALVAFTRDIAAGRLESRTIPPGAAETQTLGEAMNRMVGELGQSRRQLAQKERLEKELEIAAQIQTSILPHTIQVRGFEIAARMLPASEVGGDYYDVIPVPDGCWIGIGDVAGHGLTAGLVMLMVQSGAASLVRQRPGASPSDLLAVLNEVLYDNVHERMGQSEHVTLSLLRCHRDGSVAVAGAHQDVIVCRAGGAPEPRVVPGTWLAMLRDVRDAVPEQVIQLAPGDQVVLYTDGITEAHDGSRRMFGSERLCQALARAAGRTPAEVCDEVLQAVAAWSPGRDDDRTLIVARYQGEVDAEHRGEVDAEHHGEVDA